MDLISRFLPCAESCSTEHQVFVHIWVIYQNEKRENSLFVNTKDYLNIDKSSSNLFSIYSWLDAEYVDKALQ